MGADRGANSVTHGDAALSGLVLGLANAAHCAGMCGVFAVRAAARRGATSFAAWASGKAVAYAALGALAGAAGRGAMDSLGLALPWIALAAAAFLLVSGVRMILPPRTAGGSGAAAWIAAPLADAAGAAHRSGAPFLAGAATALLPCGAVYVAAAQAAGSASPSRGALAMTAFGLGTVPVLALVAFAGAGLVARLGPARLRAAGGWLCIAAGVVAAARAALALASEGGAPCCH